jgi:hypothetical protein
MDSLFALKEKRPLFEKVVDVHGVRLTFRAVTRLDYETKRLWVTESHILERNDGTRTTSEYDFVMQCWTRDEPHHNLMSAGFGSLAYLRDYDASSPIGATDRIVATASLVTEPVW